LSLVGHIRSSERGTETFGHGFDTVNRQRRIAEMFGYRLETVDRQRGDTETFGHWLDTADRHRVVLRRSVTGLTH